MWLLLAQSNQGPTCHLTKSGISGIHGALNSSTTIQMVPENLYIQMDNTARENKNRYVLAFCALLVELNIFKKVNKHINCVSL